MAKKKELKKIEGGKKKVSQKKQGIARYKWLKVVWFKFDELESRIDRIEDAVKLIREKLEIKDEVN